MPHILCTISDDRGAEVTYNGMPISEVIKQDIGIGGVISQLWFKKLFSPDARTTVLKSAIIMPWLSIACERSATYPPGLLAVMLP